MSVYRRGKFYWYDFEFKGRRVQRSTRQGNRRKAEDMEAAERTRFALADVGIIEREPAPMLVDFAKCFLAEVKKDRHPRTARRYHVSLNSLEKWLGQKRLSEITPEAINRYKLSRLERGCSSATVNRDLACLRRMLSLAVKQDKLSRSPFTDQKVEFLREQHDERILSFAEERLYLAVVSPTLRDVAVLILETGMRPDEVFRITERDVELNRRCLHIRSGKTKNAKREVFLTDVALEALKKRIQAIPPEARNGQADGPYLFPGYEGFIGTGRCTGYNWSCPMTQIWKAHQEAVKASGIQPRFRLYDLRHTYGTRAIEAGVDVLTLMRLMGHGSLHTTNRYIHLTDRHLEEAQRRLEAYRVHRTMAEAEIVAGNQGVLSTTTQ